MKTPKRIRRIVAICLLASFIVVAAWLSMASYYSLAPGAFAKQLARVTLVPLLAAIHNSDLEGQREITDGYIVGVNPLPAQPAHESWQLLQQRTPGFHLAEPSSVTELARAVPFVYQTASAAYLKEFRRRYRLDEVVKDSKDEYDGMLKLGAWVGTRWDHGTDEVPGGNQVCDPAAVVAAGGKGAKFWCEIAARTLTHAANALGWPARVITGSRDGYTWEHAVAEIWSNQFNKWIAIDADFNVVYEKDGVPLSAFELSTAGEKLQRLGELQVRRIAAAKASLPLADLVPFYAYIHVDLRADWCTRPLPRGSPAGGDRATWWTARKTLPPLLTAKVRVDDAEKFDWRVNEVAIYATGAEPAGAVLRIHIALAAYSPVFERFELSVDDADWSALDNPAQTLAFGAGDHSLRARVSTTAGLQGPVSQVAFHVDVPPGS